MSDTWIALRRPLFVAFAIGCTISLMATGRLTVTLIAGSMVAWAFVPTFEALGFAVAARRIASPLPFSRRVDGFFAGHGPWTVYAILVGAVASLLTPWQMNAWGAVFVTAIEVIGGLVAIRSWFIDVEFYRVVLERTKREAVRDALIQRAVCWPATAVYFGGYAAWPLITNVLSR